MDLRQRISDSIRDVPDFPKEGIVFKDITPLLQDVQLSADITDSLVGYWGSYAPDAVAGIESRGFIWGHLLAQRLGVPFIPIRKKGKLPSDTHAFAYDLEYGSAEIEMHTDAADVGHKVLIHDDLLATGGTAIAAAELVNMAGAEVLGFSFIVELGFLKGAGGLEKYSKKLHSLISY